ncbi:hypothetical protein DH2020_034623 [Rehmannia glutinosa]|uniref:Clp R domain-containing protein n=1 Tax=Rehmannia glutinosa TaxID=99300 RepID=A0ABR0VC11_REHGL
MRTGGCAVQQALTPEAAAIVTQAVALAKRRGHAQVTPLHVANTMLAAPTGLLRAACQQSHSHPLQCKALELCFNVALNRLPAGSPIKRRSLVIVGECVSKIETTVKELMDRIDRGNVPEDLKEVKFISIPPLYSFCNLQRHLVEQKMGELVCLVKSLVSKGVVLYLGDLNWISEYRVSLEKERSYYCSVEHMIMEIGRLVNCGIGENINGKFWVMGIANFQTYMRCRNGFNSLEDVWRLSPVTIPADSLGLSLISDQSNEHSEARHGREENGSCRLLISNGEVELNCCADCSSKFEAEAKKLENGCDTNEPISSNLPPWLKDESTRLCNNNDQREIIPEIAGTILQCRSGMLRRKNKITLGNTDIKEETWLLFLGPDVKAKEKISRHLAKVVFGSYSNFVSIGISGFISLTRSDNSSGDYYYRNKRGRDEENCSSYIDRFAQAMSVNPHRVFFLDDLELADYFSRMGIKRAIERGRTRNNENGEEVSFCDAIIVLSCERFGSRSSRACSPCTHKLTVNGGGDGEEETSLADNCGPLDLNISFDDDSVVDGQDIDDLGILENVDRCVVFKFQNL